MDECIKDGLVYNVQHQCTKQQIEWILAEVDESKGSQKTYTLHKAQSEDLDKVLYEWFSVKRLEGTFISHTNCNWEGEGFSEKKWKFKNCVKFHPFSSGWLLRYIRSHNVSGEQKSADLPSTETFVEKFSPLVQDLNLSRHQIYNTDELNCCISAFRQRHW